MCQFPMILEILVESRLYNCFYSSWFKLWILKGFIIWWIEFFTGKNHVVDTYKHYSCNSNDNFLVSSSLFDSWIFLIKITILFFSLTSAHCTNNGLGYCPALLIQIDFFFLSLSLFAGANPAQLHIVFKLIYVNNDFWNDKEWVK